MEKDKSAIQSTSVSLNSQASRGGNGAPLQGEPWNIFVCGDFGFSSEKPHRVHVSGWNDFISQCRVNLSGNVPDALLGVDKPMFVEYTVDSMRDFTALAVEERAAVLVPFRDAIAALNDLLDGKIGSDRAGALIEKAAIPPVNKRAILSLVGKKTVPASLPPKTSKNPGIDNVLAMVEVKSGGEDTGASAPVSDASGALIAAVTGGSAITILRRELQEQREVLKTAVKRQVEHIARAGFFSKRYASWLCLKQVIGTIGRTKGITVTLFSCSHESLADSLAQALQSSSEQGLAPDIVFIDDEYSFSTADISRLEAIAQAASDRMCSVVTAINSQDALFSGIGSRDILAQFFDDIRFLPFKKLRSNPLARCLALCGPQMSAGDGEPVAVHAGWRVLFAWINAFLSGKSLFDCMQDQVVSPIPISCTVDIPSSIVKEAAAWGLTLFGSSAPADASVPVVTLVDDRAAGPAHSRFGYNLAVNRIMKLVAKKAAAARETGTTEELAEGVKTFLVRQLAPYDLLSSASAIAVEVDDQHLLNITVDSKKTVCGYPLQVRLSV
jgi:hypothetical protein